MNQERFVCPRCGAESFHPQDVRYGYCGRCHWWTRDDVLGQLGPYCHCGEEAVVQVGSDKTPMCLDHFWVYLRPAPHE